MMIRMIGSDIYRIRKSSFFYFFISLSAISSVILNLAVSRHMRLGISVFGNLTAFTNEADIIIAGVQYQKWLGLMGTVFICVFIGQEYNWKTWQNKYYIYKSRIKIYLSKAAVSILTFTVVFLVYEITSLISSGCISDILTPAYIVCMINSVLIYAALGSVICMISMLVKNSPANIIVSCLYIMLSQTVTENILAFCAGKSEFFFQVTAWLVNHGLLCTSTAVCRDLCNCSFSLCTFISPVIVIILSVITGTLIFRKYDL